MKPQRTKPHLPQQRTPTTATVHWKPPSLEVYHEALRLLERMIDLQENNPDDELETLKDRFRSLPGYPNFPADYLVILVRPEPTPTSMRKL